MRNKIKMRETEENTVLLLIADNQPITRLQLEKLCKGYLTSGYCMHRLLTRLVKKGLLNRVPHDIWNGMHYIIEYTYTLYKEN